MHFAARRFSRWSSALFISVLVLGMSKHSSAQITVSGVADKAVYTDAATFTVITQGNYSYSARLNGAPVPVGTAVTVTRMDYYDLWAWRTNLSSPFEVTSVLVRFIVLASDRGTPERGLMKWTPYPRIYSTAAEFAGARLQVMTPQDYPPGLPIPVIVRVDDSQDRERRCNGVVDAPGFENYGVQVIRGLGSGFLPAAGAAGPIAYNAKLHSLEAPRQINIESNTAWVRVSGIQGGSTAWPENSRIHITGNFALPANVSLTIGAGTVVKLNPLVNFTNSGVLVINGTPDRPVVFTATNLVWPEINTHAWGGFLLRGTSARLVANSAVFAGGGGAKSFDFSPGASHKSEQAVLLVHSGARVSLTNCAIINTAGQVHNGYASELTYDHCLAQRAITGGECSGGGTVLVNHSGFIEFPADNGVVNAAVVDGDYDALYFTEGTHLILNSLVGFSMDDALDSGSGGAGTMLVSNCWVESSLHEAHAWSGEGRQCWSYDTVLMNCGQGFETGWSTGNNSPLCHADRILSTANSVGLRIGDNYDWSYTGYLNVSNSLVLHNYRDLFLKTWNAASGSSWDTNSWVDRVGQCHFGTNFITAPDPRFPSNLAWEPAPEAWRLAHWMTTPPDAPVGIGLALRTNRYALSQITNEVPVRLSSFTTNYVSVDYKVVGSTGLVAGGTLQFAPGETVKNIPAYFPTTNDQVLEVVLTQPVQGEITSLGQAWFFQEPANSGPVPLVSAGSRWKYNDTGTDLGSSWRQLQYSDSAWSNGVAQLGFNEQDERTLIRSTNSSGAAIPTFYFRQTFVASNLPPLTSLSLWLLRDDGGVVYLNGTEVFRSDSMPPRPFPITYATLATNYNGGAAPPDNTIDQTNLSPSFLVTGTNIVAVEIHQQALSSSDVSFDFALTGNVMTAASPPIITRSPANQTAPVNSTAVFSVQASGAAPLAYQWWHDQKLIEDTISPVLTLTNVTPADAGSYHAIVLNADGWATSQVATLTVFDPGVDADGDGMLDSWELEHGLVVGENDANLDPDGDRFTNVAEFLAGTDPQDSSSCLKIESVRLASGSNPGVELTFRAVAGRTYTVSFTESLPAGSWLSLTNVPAQPQTASVTVQDSQAANSARRYYRLQTPAAGPSNPAR